MEWSKIEARIALEMISEQMECFIKSSSFDHIGLTWDGVVLCYAEKTVLGLDFGEMAKLVRYLPQIKDGGAHERSDAMIHHEGKLVVFENILERNRATPYWMVVGMSVTGNSCIKRIRQELGGLVRIIHKELPKLAAEGDIFARMDCRHCGNEKMIDQEDLTHVPCILCTENDMHGNHWRRKDLNFEGGGPLNVNISPPPAKEELKFSLFLGRLSQRMKWSWDFTKRIVRIYHYFRDRFEDRLPYTPYIILVAICLWIRLEREVRVNSRGES